MRTLTPYWSSRSIASDFFDEMEKFVGDFARSTNTHYDERQFDPACDVTENDEHFAMSLDIPGMKKEDIKIELNDNVLTVSGERKREVKSDKTEKFQRYEKSYGFFKRSFSLPRTVDGEKVEAQYNDGVLELILPKTQAAKSRTIEIQSNKGGVFEKFLGSKKAEDKDSIKNKAV